MIRRRLRAQRRPVFDSLESRTMLSADVGVNLGINNPYEQDELWVDVTRYSLGWWQLNPSDPPLQLTALGFPKESAATSIDMGNYPDGVYQASYRGTATITFGGIGQNNGAFTLGADGAYHGSVDVRHSRYPTGQLSISVTGIDPNNQFTNFHIITPGYSSGQEFTNAFLQKLQPFTSIRFVQWSATINSSQVNWADRVLPDAYQYAWTQGVPYEAMIELANESHKDMWINVPAMATDDYVTHLAQLIHQNLDPGLNVFVEYSNENWSAGWAENQQIYNAAQSNPLVTLKSDHTLAVAQQSAYKTKVIGDIFKSVFGSDAGRIKPILGGFTLYAPYNTTELDFLKSNYGDLSNSIDSMAIGAYVGLAGGTDVPGLTMDGVFASLNQYLNTTYVNSIDSNEAVAERYGVKLVAYEGGQGLATSGPNGPLEVQAQSDPRMYDLYRRLISIWDQRVGGKISLYNLSNYFWGTLNTVADPGTPKWDGAMSATVPAGDADLDGKATAADLTIVQANMGKTGAWSGQGDFNHDGVVNQTDVSILEGLVAPVDDTGFERDVVGSGNYVRDPAGWAWAFQGSAGVSANGSGFTSGNPPAPEGSQVAFLQGTGSMSQIVTGWTAGTYVLSCGAAQRGNYGTSHEDFRVLIDGHYVGSFTPSGTSYQNYSTAQFNVSAGAHTITIEGLNSAGGDNTAFIDTVSAVNQTPIADPGMEWDQVGAGQFQYGPTGSSWVFADGGGVSSNGSGFTSGNPAAPEGGQVAFLQGTGSMSQAVSGWAAGSYVLSFKAAQRGNYGTSRQDFRVLVDGAAVGSFTPSGTSYQSFTTAAFTVAAGSHTIAFQGLDSAGGDNTAFVDAVSVRGQLPVGDPGFELPAVGAGQFQYGPTGTPWTFAGGAGITGNFSGFTNWNPAAPEGAQAAFLQGTGSMSQTLTGLAAGSYVINFSAAQRNDAWWLESQDFQVLVDGVVVGTFSPSEAAYQRFSTRVFSLAAGSHTIMFQGLDSAGGDNSVLIDDIVMAPASALVSV
jgi:hypothetical protein